MRKVSQRTAEGIKYRVEQLLEALHYKHPVEGELAKWVSNQEADLVMKLAAVGLIAKPEVKLAAKLQPFIKSYVDERTDVKPATKEVWRQGEMGLIEFFGQDISLRNVTPGDADRYKLHLIGKKLAPMAIRKRLQFATMVFRAAVRRRLIAESPFADVSIKASMPNRERFISLEETSKLLEACPNSDWRAIVALARLGGLRCPSEVLSVRWQDVDWNAGRILVTSPKTEHHPGKGTRTIPLFPELRPVLAEAFELAPEGAVYMVDERKRASSQGKAGWRNCNLRTQFERIIKLAGLTPWPRLFHNLRSSRQTELAERFPTHVVCDWVGNSEDIARKHYFQTTDDHFAKAASEGFRGGAESDAPKAQNKAQQTHAVNRGESQLAHSTLEVATLCAASDYTPQNAATSQGGWGGIRTPVWLPP
ncbi:MAG: site-specific integrase [Planctomycetaceae bacterium]|nr:site-specific integrase [Planctomycetaceae bacterium]